MSDEETGDGTSIGKLVSAGHKVIKAAESLHNSGLGIFERLRDYSVQSRNEGRQPLTPELEGDVDALTSTTKATIAVAGILSPEIQSGSLVANTAVEVIQKDGEARQTIAHGAGAGVEVGDALVDHVKEGFSEEARLMAQIQTPVTNNYDLFRQLETVGRIATAVLGFLSPGEKKNDNHQIR